MSIKEVRSMLTRKQINRLRQLTIEDRSAFDATLRRAVNHYLSARIPNWRGTRYNRRTTYGGVTQRLPHCVGHALGGAGR